MINVADVQGIRFCLGGSGFSQWTGTLGGIRAQAGHGSRNHRTPRQVALAGGDAKPPFAFAAWRVLQEPSLFLIDCEVTPLNYEGEVEVESTHLALVKNYANPNDPRLAGRANVILFLPGA